MSDTLVERAARAICEAQGESWREPPYNSLHTDSLNNIWRYCALAALRTIREPGPAVLAQVEAQINAGNPIEWAWQGGVDAAIAEAEAEKSR